MEQLGEEIKLNPNKCCIEIIWSIKRKTITISWTQTSVVLKCKTRTLSDIKAGVEPKQVLYWNSYLHFYMLLHFAVEPKQVLYWNTGVTITLTSFSSLNPNKCCIEIHLQQYQSDRQDSWTQTSVVLKYGDTSAVFRRINSWTQTSVVLKYWTETKRYD